MAVCTCDEKIRCPVRVGSVLRCTPFEVAEYIASAYLKRLPPVAQMEVAQLLSLEAMSNYERGLMATERQ